MVSFQCSKCGDVVKKPKVVSHAHKCGTNVYSCVDCMESFDMSSIGKHNSCLTEVERYQGKWRQTTNSHFNNKVMDSSEDENDVSNKKNKTVLQRPIRPPLSFTDSDDDEMHITKTKKKNGVKTTSIVTKVPVSPIMRPTVNKSPLSSGKKRIRRSVSMVSVTLPHSTVEMDRRETAARETDGFSVKVSLGNEDLIRGLMDDVVQDLSSRGSVTRAAISEEFVMLYKKRITKAFTKTLDSFIREKGY